MWHRAACVAFALLTVFCVLVGHGMIDANGGGWLWDGMLFLFCGGIAATVCISLVIGGD
jgi:hypothetical protein